MLAISIDDVQENLELIEAYVDDIKDLEVKSFSKPAEALEHILLNSDDIDIIFVDYMMPNMNGVELIQGIRVQNTEIPIVMITAASEPELKVQALEAGATEFLNKPVGYAEFIVRVKNLLALRQAQLKLKNKALLLEDEVKKATEQIVHREKEALMLLGRIADAKDDITGKHIMRVAHYSKLIANELNMGDEYSDIIFHAAPLHDIGKVSIPMSLLKKEGRLTEEEMEFMKTHTITGYNILKDSKSKYIKMGSKIARSHHEKYDGSGYPDGIEGEDIPMCARISSVADVFDALTSKRSYKDGWSIDSSFEFLREKSGTEFDPKVVDALIKNRDKVKEIHESLCD